MKNYPKHYKDYMRNEEISQKEFDLILSNFDSCNEEEFEKNYGEDSYEKIDNLVNYPGNEFIMDMMSPNREPEEDPFDSCDWDD